MQPPLGLFQQSHLASSAAVWQQNQLRGFQLHAGPQCATKRQTLSFYIKQDVRPLRVGKTKTNTFVCLCHNLN